MRLIPKAGDSVKWKYLGLVLAILLASDLLWRASDLRRYRSNLKEARRFNVRTFVKDRASCTLISDENKRPVYMETDQNHNGIVDSLSYYMGGRQILQVSLDENTQLPKGAAVSFYDGQGNPQVMWLDHSGRGEFVDRIVHEEGEPRMEIWFEGRWVAVKERKGKKGITIGGTWSVVHYDRTNNVWSISQANKGS